MKILLVKPHYSTIQISPPLGPMYLSSALKRERPGDSVKLVDLRLYRQPAQAFSAIFREFLPDVTAFTLVNVGDMPAVRELAETAKKLRADTHVVCGGPYVTSTPEDFADAAFADSIVRGEGEEIFPRLAAALETGTARELNIPGLSVRRPGGELPIPEKADPIQNLDSLPYPDWDAIEFNTYSERPQVNGFLKGRRYMAVFTSRGCPYKCAFCHNTFGKKTRLRSAENVVGEIEKLVRHYGVDEIQVFDDIFNVDKRRVLDICDLIIEKKLKIHISFPNGLRGDIIDEETILKLKEAGAYSMAFAIESAAPRIRELISKTVKVEKVEGALRTAMRNGIMTRTFLMMGFPTETVEEMKETARYAMKLPTHAISLTVVAPVKGTELYEIALREIGGENMRKAGLNSYYSRDNLYYHATSFDVQRFVRKTYLRFFLHPVRLIRFLAPMPRKLNYIGQIKARLQNVVGTS